MYYIVLFSYYVEKNDFFCDSNIIFEEIYDLQNFLKNLFSKHPNANVRIYKSIEMELSCFEY